MTNREEDEPERADYAEVWRGPDGKEIERRTESDKEADYIAERVGRSRSTPTRTGRSLAAGGRSSGGRRDVLLND